MNKRFNNYTKALSKLENAVVLAWKTLKDFLNDRGNKEINGSNDASRKAFKYGLIEQGEIWMDMINSRNNSSHTYNEETDKEIQEVILNNYYSEFEKLKQKLSVLKMKGIDTLHSKQIMEVLCKYGRRV